jgi:1-acyl-sn-glycerol-3-phosphate acyltransferase
MIVAVNHLGRLDTAVLFCVVDREDIIMPVAEKYRDHPIYGAMGRAANAIWLNRFEADYSALRKILERMKQGGLLVIAPEGTRSKTEALQEGKMGVAFLASKSGYPVVPVALTGTEDRRVIENLKHFRRIKITVTAAVPFYITCRGAGLRKCCAGTKIMCESCLLPEYCGQCDHRGGTENRCVIFRGIVRS